MNLAAISDVHVKVPHDDADHLLCQFLKHPKVQEADYVLLLGDIFDLMCGPHEEYLQKFNHIFDLMDELVKKKRKVYFIEGNHDVHLEKLFKKRWPRQEVVLSQNPQIETIEGKKYYFSHGDEHEVNNVSYQRYKGIILSPPLRFVANYLLPYRVLNYLGERASKMSRKRGSKTYREDLIRESFRKGVEVKTQGQYDFIIGGHSHVKDLYKINEHSTYVNNGYALKSKSFLFIHDHQVSFQELV